MKKVILIALALLAGCATPKQPTTAPVPKLYQDKIIPIVGKAQGCVNPAVVNNYNKAPEFEADKLASRVSASCMNIPIERQVIILQSLKARTRDGGGFWDSHPSWDERIANIQGPHRGKGEAAFDKLNPQ